MEERNLQKLVSTLENKPVLHIHVTGNGALKTAALEKYRRVFNLFSEVHVHITEETKTLEFVEDFKLTPV